MPAAAKAKPDFSSTPAVQRGEVQFFTPPRTIGLTSIVVYVQPYKREPRAAIVAAMRDGKPDLAVFSPNGGSNIAMAVPHVSAATDIDKTGAWRWPDEA